MSLRTANISVAVIGLGRAGSQYDQGKLLDHARSHVGAVLQTEGCELVAVVDKCVENCEQFVADWGVTVPCYTDYSLLLAECRPDVLSVCTPTASHHEVVMAAIAMKPRLIFCEKPFGSTIEQTREMLAEAQKQGVAIAVNYHRRWEARIAAFQKIIHERGAPLSVMVRYGKGLYNYGSHIIDLALYWLGPIDRVTPVETGCPDPSILDPSYSFQLEHRSRTSLLAIGMDGIDYEQLEFEIYYKDIAYVVEFGGVRYHSLTPKDDLYYPGYRNLDRDTDFLPSGEVHGLVAAYKELIDSLKGTAVSVRCSGKHALEVMEVVDAVRESVKKQ